MKILLIYPSFFTFVKTDFHILSKLGDVSKFHYHQSKTIKNNIFNQIKLLLFLTKNILTCNLIYIWFADYHSLLPILFGKIFRKKTMLVLGGYDVASLPEIEYGAFYKRFRRFFAKYSISNADINLCVADNIQNDALNRVPSAKTRILYTGYSKDIFTLGNIDRKDIVLTVALCDTIPRIKLKGIDYFVELAKVLPQYEFVFVGGGDCIDKFIEVPSNLRLVGKLPNHEIIKYYQEAKVYAQFSMREGLPNTVCESMLCGCIPVGFNNGGIPIAIGDAGFIIKTNEVEIIKDKVIEAMDSSEDLRKIARKRILENFSIENRENSIYRLVEK